MFDNPVPEDVLNRARALPLEAYDGVDGVLLDARREVWFDDQVIYVGRVFGDKKQRFADGAVIRTSYVVADADETGLVRTRNSAYRVVLAPVTTDDA